MFVPKLFPSFWNEPLKWHTEMGTVSGKGNGSEEKAVLPEISEDGG
jgi:hypothetical protein